MISQEKSSDLCAINEKNFDLCVDGKVITLRFGGLEWITLAVVEIKKLWLFGNINAGFTFFEIPKI